MKTVCASIVALTLTMTAALSAQAPAQPPTPPPGEAEQPPIYTEAVVVTASKIEQQLVNAPATVSVVSSDVIQSSPATNYAELLRSVPGMNITQTSARDFNINMRGATSTLSTSQLALIDGRSLYLDFFGFVAWDFLPVNPNEIRQIEVIRGPASAVWGANALSGVVNFITKTPREMAGTSFTMGVGSFGRDVNDNGRGNGSLWYFNGTHAAAVNDRWAYKISAGALAQDALPRPQGLINNPQQTPYPFFANSGTRQPKLDARVDYDAPEGAYRLSFAGGFAGTEGIIHTGIGPFDMNRGTKLAYGSAKWTKGAQKFSVFTNILDGDANALLSFGADGQPIPFLFNTRTFDAEYGNVISIGTRQVISFGGNARYNSFDLSLAPRGDSRSEGGAYVQDEIFINDYLRWVVGARLDRFSVLDKPNFSPRTAVIVKPTADQSLRFSFNRAFRAPSLINNFLEVGIVNQLDLRAIPNLAPVIPFLPGGPVYNFPVQANGNESLVEQQVDAFEVAYTGYLAKRATVTAAFYYNKSKDDIFFTQVGRYRAANPPPGWVSKLAVVGPATALGILEVLPPSCVGRVECTNGGLPSEFSYRNLGSVVDKGVELGVDAAVNRALNVFANYSYQFTPDPDFDISEVNLPPTNRFNAGFSFSQGMFLGNMNVSYQDSAFWQDVLDSRFHGSTDAYTQVNGAFGVKWGGDKVTTTIKFNNLLDKEIQSHIFGDILRRQVIGELRVQF
ncbi:MAG: TonB-dependent receptor [Acidobacteria bacterium]|nr:TonB-dependent receptor [Acidobacteriota bacterium]